jgi:hypothetical protein
MKIETFIIVSTRCIDAETGKYMTKQKCFSLDNLLGRDCPVDVSLINASEDHKREIKKEIKER